MQTHTTVVIRMPTQPDEKQSVDEALAKLRPYITGSSIEDEMTLLELIQEHGDFPGHIADEARAKVAELQRQSETVSDS